MSEIQRETQVDQKVKEFTEKSHSHGMNCGQKIAEVAAFLHPNALLIVPLYRSCIVVEQDEQDKKDGSCTIHGYADPHWLGRDIDAHSLKSDTFHDCYKIHGDRQGPSFAKKNVEIKE